MLQQVAVFLALIGPPGVETTEQSLYRQGATLVEGIDEVVEADAGHDRLVLDDYAMALVDAMAAGDGIGRPVQVLSVVAGVDQGGYALLVGRQGKPADTAPLLVFSLGVGQCERWRWIDLTVLVWAGRGAGEGDIKGGALNFMPRAESGAVFVAMKPYRERIGPDCDMYCLVGPGIPACSSSFDP